MSDTTREIVRRWYHEIWNEHRTETIDELLSAQAIGHYENGDIQGPGGFRELFDAVIEALPDVSLTVDAILAEGPNAVVRWSATGTHLGASLGPKPTGRRLTVRGMSWHVVRDGQVVEGWESSNLSRVLRDLEDEANAPAQDAAATPRTEAGSA